MSESVDINWERLKDFAERLGQPKHGGGSVHQEDLQAVDEALDTLIAQDNYAGIVRLRRLFTAVVARDSISVHKSLQRLTDEAIRAADKIGDIKEQAHLLGANGHNLHRQGLHQQSLDNFYRAYQLYEQIGEPFEALKNYFMMALCHRALGNVAEAIHILQNVMARVGTDDPWFGNPLNVLAWIERDNQHLAAAETMFRRALALHRQSSDPDILVAGTLADLGEVLALQGQNEEAAACFAESLAFIRKYEGQFDRQEARTEMKLAELLIRERKYSEALSLLNHADDLIAYGAYKDQLWKIELLRAMIKFRQRNLGGALRRLRSAKTIYEELGLPTSEFIRHTVNRLKLGSGLFTLTWK
jgi:tetratricopeptide (TPR) repeat protein